MCTAPVDNGMKNCLYSFTCSYEIKKVQKYMVCNLIFLKNYYILLRKKVSKAHTEGLSNLFKHNSYLKGSLVQSDVNRHFIYCDHFTKE